MGNHPQTYASLLKKLDVDGMEHVEDIGPKKKYGVLVSGLIKVNGKEMNVLGSVVLDESTGEPQTGKGTGFHAYPEGMTGEPVTLVLGNHAIETVQGLYKTNKINYPFKPKSEADIRPDAR